MPKVTKTELTENQRMLEEEDRKDVRDDHVEELFNEAVEMYADTSASGHAIQQLDHEGLRNVMRLCWEQWGETK